MWSMDPVSLCRTIGARARQAFTSGRASFALPEASPVASLIRDVAPTTELRGAAHAWLSSNATYHEAVQLCARAVVAFDALHEPAPEVYRSKVAGELASILDLWPWALVLPTCETLSERDLLELRAFPLFPLGITACMAWVDGRRSSPSELFFHDLDHTRFKIRESLRDLGIDVPDAYQDGSTLDPETGKHRSILASVQGELGNELWHEADAAHALGAHLLERIDRMPDPVLGRACELLLFEITHEKSFPLSRRALARELGSDSHVEKLRRKHAEGYFGALDPGSKVISRLADAQARLILESS